MGNRKFRLANIIPVTFRRFARKSVTLESPVSTQVSELKQPQHYAKPVEGSFNKTTLPVRSFDQMLLISSSSRRSDTELLAFCSKTEHALPRPTLTQPHLHRRRKVHTNKCCRGVRLKQKSARLHGFSNARRSASGSSSSSSSGFGSKKKRGLSETSVTVVKSSADPEKDFKESMVEMIVENNITDLDELDELLVSYLMLNSDEFHKVIVNAFKEILIGLFTKPKN